ncbi:MAG: N-6 DNA methylase [Gammaproteobacteria bacterium]|nr:N-6 DNA methylase [Gammaproteobacteria bacterium]
MNKKRQLGQFYTPKAISDVLVKRALAAYGSQPQSVLELAAGDGRLLRSILDCYPSCRTIAVEIDVDNIRSLTDNYPGIEVIHADAISPTKSIDNMAVDLGLGNPPFLSNIIVDDFKKSLISEYIGLEVKLGQKVRAEVLFIAQYMKNLKYGGLLSIILPSSIVSGSRHAKLRTALSRKYSIQELYQIVDSGFSGTEAQTFVLSLKNELPNENGTFLRKVNLLGEVVEETFVSQSSIEIRMDPDFYLTDSHKKNTRLGDSATITRGTLTNGELKSIGLAYVHTTNFDTLRYSSPSNTDLNGHFLETGDVIMCRVGSRVVGKVKEYQGPQLPFSDCIYRIRFKAPVCKKRFLEFARSEHGVRELLRISKGVCSKYITVEDLKNFLF